jgi:hypothetical protein
MVMIEGGGGVVQKTENIRTIRTGLDETQLTTYVSTIRYVVEKASGYPRGDLDWRASDRTSCGISLVHMSLNDC